MTPALGGLWGSGRIYSYTGGVWGSGEDVWREGDEGGERGGGVRGGAATPISSAFSYSTVPSCLYS